MQAARWSMGDAQKQEFAQRGAATPDYLELHGQNAATVFADAITAAKRANPSGAAVHVYPTEDYAKMKLFLTDNGKGGVAVKPDGDIVSVFNTPGAGNKGMVLSALHLATQNGGNKLDAFDTVLPHLYAKAGFKAVARMHWNDDYAPEGWDKTQFEPFNHGEPDVVFMAHDPKHGKDYAPTDGAVTDDYDKAVAMQAAAVKPTRHETQKRFNAVGATLGVRSRRYI